MPPADGRERRPLPYEALDPQWEAHEFQKFRATAGARQQAPYGAYLFGRLLQSDLHQSCRPALPAEVAKLNGSTIQGMCILQVVDVANIGANYEHRTEFTPAGPTRTLKLGLTDGHQLVFGFEFHPLPQFSMNIARGTKIVVENVPVRHGLLMLAPDNCQLLETTSDRHNRKQKQAKDSAVAEAGAYSAALITAQFNTSQEPKPATQPTVTALQTTDSRPTGPANADNGSVRSRATRFIEQPTPSRADPARRTTNSSMVVANERASDRAKNKTEPSVFVDLPSSDEDFGSDTTDPTVEHLFYSPKTPRWPADTVSTIGAAKANSVNRVSRKRPRSPSIDQKPSAPAASQARQSTALTRPAESGVDVVMEDAEDKQGFSFSLLGGEGNSNSTMTSSPPLDPTRPFQYFKAKVPALSAASLPTRTATTLQIHACIKSVIGFQFNTGRYQLRVSVEDCTAAREADVADAFVTRLMGVPCSEFVRTMQTKPQVAHGWAANMQFTLMTLEGIMTFKVNTATSAPGAVPLVLEGCRDFHLSDTRKLLQRVKSSLSTLYR